MAEPMDSVGWVPNFAGIRPMDDHEASRLRNLCDIYMDPRDYVCGGGLTRFDVDGLSVIRDFATTALNAFNEKEQKNFRLEAVVKINTVPITCYMTFWARSDESDERHLFRAVVNGPRRHNVLLCEIKDDEEISIQAEDEDYDVKPKSEDDHSPENGTPLGLQQNHTRTYVRSLRIAGPMAEPVDSFGWVPNFAGIRPMDDNEASRLRNLCDIYMDPRDYVCGGGLTEFDVDGSSVIRDFATTALNAYNEKEQKNFHVEKVVKLNAVPITCYMTFWARSDESDERHLFRAVVNGPRRHNVLLCEIKDDEEITIQAEDEEYDVKPKSEDDHSPENGTPLGLRQNHTPTYLRSLRTAGPMAEPLDSFGWVPNFAGIRPMDDDEASRLRNLCDIYMDPRDYVCGGGLTEFDVDGSSVIRDFATAALNAYNEKEVNKLFNIINSLDSY